MKGIARTVVLAVGLGILAGACAQADPTVDSGAPAEPPAGLAAATEIADPGSDRPHLDAAPVGEITDEEVAGILWMREEEKLARDVYLSLFDLWGTRIFSNIASSEEKHMDAVAALIERYGLIDPVGDNPVGVFTDSTLQKLYDDLVAQGAESLTAALEVGASIEELDIDDLRERATDAVDIDLVYANLEKGSRNHLRAFTRNLSNRGIDYEPAVLTIADFEAIVTGETERGSA